MISIVMHQTTQSRINCLEHEGGRQLENDMGEYWYTNCTMLQRNKRLK